MTKDEWTQWLKTEAPHLNFFEITGVLAADLGLSNDDHWRLVFLVTHAYERGMKAEAVRGRR